MSQSFLRGRSGEWKLLKTNPDEAISSVAFEAKTVLFTVTRKDWPAIIGELT